MADAVDLGRLLAQIGQLCRRALGEDPEGRAVAAALGLQDARLLEQFAVGYAGQSFAAALPTSGGVRGALADLGLLDAHGAPVIAGHLVVPVPDVRGQVVGLAAIGPDGTHLLFPTDVPLHGLSPRIVAGRPAVIVGTVLEAMRLLQAGVPTVLALNPAAAEAESRALTLNRPSKAFVDTSAPGVVAVLQRLEVPTYLLKVEPQATLAQIQAAIDAAEPAPAPVGVEATARVADGRVLFDCSGRRYELKDLDPDDPNRLRVQLRAVRGTDLHVDTLDLFAAGSRTKFAVAAAAFHTATAETVEGDLRIMIRKLESIREAERRRRKPRSGAYEMTEAEEAEALDYLGRPSLLDRVAQDLERLGFVGEQLAKRLGYLVTVSRKLESPLSAVVLSRAGSGKSTLLDLLGDLLPPEDLVRFTRMTPASLYYAGGGDLRNKVLLSGEDEGLEGCDYSLRELISAKVIRLAAPVRDGESGQFRIEQTEVRGPVSLLFSTTKPAIHFENLTRLFTLSMTESADQTHAIHMAQRLGRTAAGLARRPEQDALRKLHRNLHRLLRPLAVVNPFAEHLDFPTTPLETRREHAKYLSLIDASALLNQYQRPRGRTLVDGREIEFIEVAIEDIEVANSIMSEVLGEAGDGLARPSRELLGLVRRMVEDRARAEGRDPRHVIFNRRQIREHTGWSDAQVKAHVGQLLDLELLVRSQAGHGKTHCYQLRPVATGVARGRLPGLTDPEKLRAMVRKSGVVGYGLVTVQITNLMENPGEPCPKV